MGAAPSLAAARDAHALLRRDLPVTRLVTAPSLTAAARCEVYLKLESELPTGSFKPRGALYALAVNAARRSIREVTASSTGNHGAAVAFAAARLGIPATIFLPAAPNPVKRARIAALGARIVEVGGDDLAAAF
ncbi:MAG: pyridoxal-phosphate dependent enzyme, partial [Gemmatimonadaceae bacterium]|nr:pyridoxal-phosphate dependent enzyme [Gemmatimonadaceae bacterium]